MARTRGLVLALPEEEVPEGLEGPLPLLPGLQLEDRPHPPPSGRGAPGGAAGCSGGLRSRESIFSASFLLMRTSRSPSLMSK